VASAFAHAAAEYGGLDILISNAGISSAAPIDETDLASGTATWTSWQGYSWCHAKPFA